MTTITAAKEFTYAWIVKIWILLLMFWFVIALIYVLAKGFGVSYELFPGVQNRIAFLFLVIISHILVALLVAGITNILSNSVKLTIDDRGITLSKGILNKKETIIGYFDIREAHTVPGPLAFVDDFFGVEDIIIHGSSTITMSGLNEGEKIASEITDRANAKKKEEKFTFEQLLNEVKALREEVNQLKLERKIKRKLHLSQRKKRKRKSHVSKTV